MKTLLPTCLALVSASLCPLAAAQLGQKLWEFEAGGGSSSPAIGADGTVYVAAGNRSVYALDGATGQKRWEFQVGSSLAHSSPAISPDGTVYVGAVGTVYALNGATGQKIWEFPTVGPVDSSPAVGVDGTVYFGSNEGIVYALNGATGQKVWGAPTGGVVFSSPAIGVDGTVYVASTVYSGGYRGILHALNGATGQKLWDFYTGDVVNSSPAIGADGTVYIGSEDYKVYALDGATGIAKWQFSTRGPVDSSPAIGPDGTVYFGSGDHKVYALNRATGWKAWEFLTEGYVKSSPAIGADGTLYIGSYEGKVYALNGATGSKIWEFPTGGYVGSSPAIGADGTVYVLSMNGKIYALASRSTGGVAQGPWPKFRGDARNTGQVNTQPVVPPPVSFMTNQVFVTRLAGAGSQGYADGTGADAQFSFPNGGSVDLAGNVFIADSSNHRIRKVSPQGIVSTVAGTGVAGYADGPAATSQFSNPLGVCVDATGNVFVADSGNHRIRKLGVDGQVSTIAGSGLAGYQDGAGTAALLNKPNDVVVDAVGNLFVTEFDNHTVRRITPEGTVSTWAGNGTAGYVDGPSARAQLNQPGGIALDRDGNLYVTEWGGQRIRKISASGEVSTVAGDGAAGYLDGPAMNARFNNPDGAVVDGEGNLYIADNGNHVIRRVSPEGVVETVAGTSVAGLADGEGFEAQFTHPGGLGLDIQGNLFVADGGNHSVRKIVIVWPLVITPELVVRRLPGDYEPGMALVVALEAKPPSHTTSYAVQDQPPAGWTVSSISDGGRLDAVNGLVEFGPFLDSQPRTLTYVVVPPSSGTGIRHFTGSFSMNGEESPLGGAAQLGPKVFPPTIHYRVIWNSTLSETCTECDHPTATYPLRGSAEMQYFSSIMGATWTFSNIELDTVNAGSPQYHITGSGVWSDSGQFSVPSYVTLHLGLQIDDGTTNRPCTIYRRNVGSIPLEQIFTVGGPQINGTPPQTFSISLSMAPVHDLWFSTRRGLTPSGTNAESARVENGDVLSDSGRVVKGNADLLRPFGITPDPALSGYDIDALNVAPGGEIVFSLREDVLSPTAGLLRHGDLLSDGGRVVKTNQELLQAFGLMPPAQDVGLDGIEALENNRTFFSIATNVFSEKLGKMLTSGDLLFEDGSILYSNQQLLGAFQPKSQDQNYGLAAFHTWRGSFGLISEVWFCTEKGFDSALGPIAAGDLISSRGYIVYRNLELVAQFEPLEDLADFGLDGLFLVSDPQPRSLVSTPLSRLTSALSPSGLILRWETTGRVSQVERASNVEGHFLPVSPVLPGLEWLDTGLSGAKTPAFHRLRVW